MEKTRILEETPEGEVSEFLVSSSLGNISALVVRWQHSTANYKYL
jgi:hypothetical protein